MSDELTLLGREIEKLDDRKREEETLPLLKKGLTYINGFLIRENDWGHFSSGIHYCNEAMKRSDRINATRFFVQRTLVSTNVTFIIVLFLKKGEEQESWKFFIGNIPRDDSLE